MLAAAAGASLALLPAVAAAQDADTAAQDQEPAATAADTSERPDGGPNEGDLPIAPAGPTINAAAMRGKECLPYRLRVGMDRTRVARLTCRIRVPGKRRGRVVGQRRNARWAVVVQPRYGTVRIRNGRPRMLVYTPDKNFRGNDEFVARVRAPGTPKRGLRLQIGLVVAPGPVPPAPQPSGPTGQSGPSPAPSPSPTPAGGPGGGPPSPGPTPTPTPPPPGPPPPAPTCQDATFTVRANGSIHKRLPCRGRGGYTVSIERAPASGTLQLDDPGNGTFTYKPDRQVARTRAVRFRFRATGPGGSSPLSTGTFEVEPAIPTCEDITSQTAYQTAVTLDLPCGGAGIRFEIAGEPKHGSVTVDPRTGRAVYTPADDYFTPAGEAGDRFVFRAVNSSGESRRGTAVVNVTPPPGTCDNAQPATTPYQTPVEIELPCQGNEIYLEIEDPPGHGTLGEIDQDTKKVTYTPNENYFTATGADPDTFTFTATNRGGKAEPRTATVTVLPPPPTCEPAKPVQTQNRTPVEIKLDCKGDAPELEIVDQPEHGTLGDIDQENGTVTYTPDDDYFTPEGGEPDRFTFRASNRGGAGEPVPATIEVFPPKGTCEDTEATTPYRTAVDVKLPCKGDELEFEITKQPEHGKLGEIDQENGTVTYTPDEDSFTATGADPDTFSFTASNRGGKADARTATVTVLPPVPECKAVGPVQTDNQTPVTVRLECTGDDPRISIVDPPQHGTLGDIDQQNGTVTYTPNDDYFTPKDGEPDRFTFRASNRGGDGDPVAATVDVLPPKPACTPAEPVTTPFQTPADVTLKCTGPELVREIVDQPQHGKLGDVDQGKGTVQYTPDEGYYTPKDGQPDQFTYRATNRAGASDAVAAQVTTLPDRPTCTDAEPAKTPSGTAVTIKLPCEGVDIQWKIVNQPNNGTLGDIDQNAGTVVYTPKQGYFTPRDGQPDRFTFRATNRAGDSGAAAAAVTVEPPAPTCEALSTDTRYETAKAITPKCTAPESEFAIKTQPGHGKLSDLDPATGAVRYTPDKGYYSPLSPVTPDTFTLTATNRTGSADVKVSIRVLPPPATCEAVSKKGNYAKDIALDLKCTGPALKSIEVAGQPGNGKVSLGSPSRTNQTLTVPATYTPNAKFVGDDTFTFAGVSDPGGRGPVATGSVTIEPFKFRAIGDSVTAGFGYYSDGSSMGLLSLFKCKPGEIPNDRCSSNSTLGDNAGDTTPKYSSDWGFGNQVSWAAQYAKRLNLKPGTNFKNLAVTGSEPVNWAKGNGTKEENDYLNKTLEQVVADNPDMTVMTLGANPLLSMFLLGEQRFECSWKLSEAALKACLDKYVNQVKLDDRLTKIYNRLLDAPDNRVVVSLYPTVIPAVAVQPPLISYWPNQLEYMEIEINKRIESIVNKVKQSNPPARANRIFVSKPERTYIGLNSNYVTNQTCGVDFLHAKTDGSSRQAGIAQGAIVTQVALHAAPAFSWLVFPPAIAAASYTYAMTQFCPSGTYWTIEGDTGIHPSKAGYTVMADALQKVANDNKLVPPLP